MNQHPGAASAPVHDAPRVAELLGIITLTARDLAELGPPPEPREGFVTFFDPGWSILRLRDATACHGVFRRRQLWYVTEAFAAFVEPMRYRQLRMAAAGDTFRKAFAEQRDLLGQEEEVPTARIVLAATVIHRLATGERLFPFHGVRCLDRTRSRQGVAVYGCGVYEVRDDFVIPRLGLAAARKVAQRTTPP